MKRRNLPFHEVDIDGDEGLVKAYGERIPVLLAPDDMVIAEGRIERAQLRRAIGEWSSRLRS